MRFLPEMGVAMTKQMPKELTRQQYQELYYYMRLNRAVEDTMVKLFRQNKIVGGLYSSLGQEAISVGTCYALEKKDWIAPMIRNIGALLVKGVPPRDIFMQHMAKYDSPTKGRDGTSHFGDLENLHIVSPISMLGDLIPVMTGVAIGARYLGQKVVTMTWIGDGGSSTGVFHEGLNFAATQKAPFVLILENNLWAYSTPVRRQVPIENLADRAKAYGIDSYIVDGNNVVAVVHWEARDPVALYEKFLTAEKLLDAAGKKEIDDKLDTLLAAEREFAENSPLPPAEFAEGGVYCAGDECHKIRAKWERPIAEVTPPRSSVKAVWTVPGFGSGKGSGRANAPIHFGDTKTVVENPANNGRPAKAGAKLAAKNAPKKAKAAASASRKGRR